MTRAFFHPHYPQLRSSWARHWTPIYPQVPQQIKINKIKILHLYYNTYKHMTWQDRPESKWTMNMGKLGQGRHMEREKHTEWVQGCDSVPLHIWRFFIKITVLGFCAYGKVHIAHINICLSLWKSYLWSTLIHCDFLFTDCVFKVVMCKNVKTDFSHLEYLHYFS